MYVYVHIHMVVYVYSLNMYMSLLRSFIHISPWAFSSLAFIRA